MTARISEAEFATIARKASGAVKFSVEPKPASLPAEQARQRKARAVASMPPSAAKTHPAPNPAPAGILLRIAEAGDAIWRASLGLAALTAAVAFLVGRI